MPKIKQKPAPQEAKCPTVGQVEERDLLALYKHHADQMADWIFLNFKGTCPQVLKDFWEEFPPTHQVTHPIYRIESTDLFSARITKNLK